MKPIIRKAVSENGDKGWSCTSELVGVFGLTKPEAYDNWLQTKLYIETNIRRINIRKAAEMSCSKR